MDTSAHTKRGNMPMPMKPNLRSMDEGEMPMGRQPYPKADDIPELNQPEKDMQGADNPVVQALKTLQVFVSAAEEKGMPAAGALKEHLAGFVQTLLQGKGAAGEGPGMSAPSPTPEEDSEEKFNPFEAPPDEPRPMRKKRNVNYQPAAVPLV